MTYVADTFRSRFWVASLGFLFLAGCATSVPSQQVGQGSPATTDARTEAKESPNRAQELEQPPPAVENTAFEAENSQALQTLWSSRTAATSSDKSSDLVLGPGDVLRISLPQFDNQKDRTVRVSEENTIALPLLGVINVSGMNEAQLRDELSRRLETYVYHPQVAVFLDHTENREVAVLGSVKTPGRYMLDSRSDTMMTMIGRAGGLTDAAASRIILVPAPRTKAPDGSRPPATTLAAYPPEDASAPTQQTFADQVVINLSRTTNQHYLQLPARAGDVIIVPSAGDVTVEGWVPNPGTFKITQGMTALSAIAAAGGPQFTSSATLLREQGDGGKLDIPLDLSKLKNGTEPDVPLQGGDVVVVERSVVGAVPYSLYFLIQHFGMGLGLPLAF
jgi:protein involved in polysaccharide export with SLBB domain